MAALADGRRAAFAPLYAALWPLLRDFCRRALSHEADGDDAAQQALLQLFARAVDYDETRDAVAWAIGIALLWADVVLPVPASTAAVRTSSPPMPRSVRAAPTPRTSWSAAT